MEVVMHFIDVFLHIDKHLAAVAGEYGWWTLAILFVIVFCETGLVVTPFLPGDSLLFAAGALTVQGFFGVPELLIALIIAAILGDSVNYAVGKWIGPRVFKEQSRFFKLEYIERTQLFYEKFGGKAIIIARFVPIIRTFAPFLAGVGVMSYPKFALYNVVGAILWVVSFCLAGHYFANMPIVKNNFTLVIMGIIVLSLVPVALEMYKAKNSRPAGA
jgi:membrane-associated protein